MAKSATSADVSTPLLQRVGAAWAAALLLFLAVASASPSVHHWLHRAGADADDACAVVLFANGITIAAAALALALPALAWSTCWIVRHREFFVATPRYLRLPERGPPGC